MDAVLIVDRADVIGAEDVVDEGHHLVANAFDAVLAAAVVEEGGAFFGLERADDGVGELRFDFVTGGQGSGGSWGGDEGRDSAVAVKASGFEGTAAGDVAVKAVIGQEFELG